MLLEKNKWTAIFVDRIFGTNFELLIIAQVYAPGGGKERGFDGYPAFLSGDIEIIGPTNSLLS